MTQHDIEIEKAKVDYSAIYRISNEVFTQAACDILDIPMDLLEVRRNIMSGKNFGTLCVIIYQKDDTEKAYYRLDNKAIHYDYLPPNIDEFKKALILIKMIGLMVSQQQ